MTTENTYGRSGVPVHPTHFIYDSTKIKQFQTCPRQYFEKFILGHNREGTNVHIEFGRCIHTALEVLAELGPVGLLEAHDAFLEAWKEVYPVGVLTMEQDKVKNPDRAFTLLKDYIQKYGKIDRPEDVEYIEICGTVPIADDRSIHWKTDAIRRKPPGVLNEGKLFVLEHKTSGKTWLGPWRDKWHYDFQVGCYNFALFCLVDDYNDTAGVEVDGLITWPKKNHFERIPVRKSIAQLESWLVSANYWIDEIERNMALLAESSPDDRVMFAFHSASEPCSQQFNGCPFQGRCSIIANPLRNLDRIPEGHVKKFWDPSAREKTSKNVFHLEKK